MKKNNDHKQYQKASFFANEMTQQELAEKVGVSRQTIISIEAGKYSPSLQLAFLIADAFDVKIDEAFDYEVKGENP